MNRAGRTPQVGEIWTFCEDDDWLIQKIYVKDGQLACDMKLINPPTTIGSDVATAYRLDYFDDSSWSYQESRQRDHHVEEKPERGVIEI